MEKTYYIGNTRTIIDSIRKGNSKDVSSRYNKTKINT